MTLRSAAVSGVLRHGFTLPFNPEVARTTYIHTVLVETITDMYLSGLEREREKDVFILSHLKYTNYST